MSVSKTADLCESNGVNAAHQGWQACLVTLLLVAAGFSAVAQDTNNSASTNAPAPAAPAPAISTSTVPSQATSTQAPSAQVAPSPPVVASAPSRGRSASSRLDDSAFRIISERNIFNANRSGGPMRLSSRRQARVEGFTLVGTMAYEKGAFAFFDGTSSEFTKVLKTDGVIAGHKVVDILADAVKLEADGKILELPIGAAMRREDEGTWHQGEGIAGNGGSSSNRDSDSSDRSSRSNSASTSSAPSADASEILKRLMERREKDSQ
jgi:hypothetical protein